MPEIVADPSRLAAISCFPDRETKNINDLILIPSRLARATRAGVLRRAAPAIHGAAARHPQSQAAGARSCGPAAERTGAVGAARTQAASVTAPRPANLAAAACCHPAAHLGIDLSSLRTADEVQQVLSTVLIAIARGEITPAEGARIARRVRVRLRAGRARTPPG